MQNVVRRIFDYSLEEIMEKRFSRYSKSIIQDRALPDVRDGLKPVQRRILYGMYKEGHTFEKTKTVKSARCVGDIMGKYHPHGDYSIYEAMVRMSQWWKQNHPLIFMQGNNGSMDGDGAAAMRYTEAKLSKISSELINEDIDKNTVLMSPNFDDTLIEPTVLPARFPNLLVNGSTGISAGYATNIPPHNLSEVIDATIYRLDHNDCSLEDILKIVKGPDFPTGGIVYSLKGIEDAFRGGKGKIMIRSKYEVIKNKGKSRIIITEVPFDVNKAILVKKIDEIRLDKKIDGISEVREESDRENPVRIVIDLKKDANEKIVINYLLKNTDLQISYNYNMVAIVNKRPMTLGIIALLDAYISHQKEIITKRTTFDLAHAKERMHIIDGLVRALSMLDDIIKTIKASKNKIDAEKNLVIEYQFTEKQARAIVVLQLYKLTNTDITELLSEKASLESIILEYEKVLETDIELKKRMKKELLKIKKEYGNPRKTLISDESAEIKLDTTHLIPKEDVIVVVTKEGYIKRVSKRSYNKDDNTLVKEGDYVIGLYEMNTLDVLLLFTDFGNYLYVPVYTIPDLKWKELGKHISNLISIDAKENIIYAQAVSDFNQNAYITIFTINGMVKRSKLSDFKVVRYSRPITCIKLKENDKVVSVENCNEEDTIIATKKGYILRYLTNEIPITGLKTGGVKAISLKEDEVISAHICNENSLYITLFTSKGTGKRIRITDFERSVRARRGLLSIRDIKTNPYMLTHMFIIKKEEKIQLLVKDNIIDVKITDLPISDRYSVGTHITKEPVLNIYLKCECKLLQTNKTSEEEIEVLDLTPSSLEEIDGKIYKIEDFLDDFKIE